MKKRIISMLLLGFFLSQGATALFAAKKSSPKTVPSGTTVSGQAHVGKGHRSHHKKLSGTRKHTSHRKKKVGSRSKRTRVSHKPAPVPTQGPGN